ncbi:MAG TPA: diaminopimelate epimerase [Nitriliruptorales bacterium]
MHFTKAHGTGNDFVVLVDLDDELDLPAALVAAICDRHTGVGADGILRLTAGKGDAAVFMDYRNADGGIVEMCGNGVRVVAAHALANHLVPQGASDFVVGTRDGDKPVSVTFHNDGHVASVTVDMGPPTLEPERVPFVTNGDTAPNGQHTLDLPDGQVRLTPVSMGNPHAVLLVDDVATAPVTTLGPQLEQHERFPQRTNVEFAAPIDRSRVRLRVWERGVGETLSCGTGACATLVALQQQDLADTTVSVEVVGGTLIVTHRPGESVLLTGPVANVYTGTLGPDWLLAVRAHA